MYIYRIADGVSYPFNKIYRYLFSYKTLDHYSITCFHIKLSLIILTLIQSKPRIMASSLSILPFHKTNDMDIDYNIESNDNTSDTININTDCYF